jgi:hypothetical protein
MHVYIFASDSHPSLSAFTSDQTAGNLPIDYAPWRAVNAGNALFIASETDPIAEAVKRDGYFLLSGKTQASNGPGAR